MGEGHVQKFIRSVQLRLIGWFLTVAVFLIGAQITFQYVFSLEAWLAGILTIPLGAIVAMAIGLVIGRNVTKPTQYIAQAIQHISPSEQLVNAPNIDELKLGHELAATLTRQIYQLTSLTHTDNGQPPQTVAQSSLPTGLFDQLPVAIVGLNEKGAITLANTKAASLLQTDSIANQLLNDRLSFLTEDEISIQNWIETTGQKNLSDVRSWQKTEVKTLDGVSLGYFDIAASFNKHSASGIEVILTFFDHSDAYSQETDSINFMALAVHELRTPVTILRGYIEAFSDELKDNPNSQISDDLRKMNAAAEGLASFVSNILNVARVNQGQLSLSLQSDSWNKILPQIVDNLRERAAVYGKTIELRMEPDLPMVAIDRMTIGEVITNLIDNAIKYSPDKANRIRIVSKINGDGLIETTVQDWGVGITSSVMPHLFSKFQRNHRNRTQIGGTGLGLFLSKAIVTAHQGNIWVHSKENEGSTFGFTLLPFNQLAQEHQTNDNETIVRSSHGWIKNHSLQRR